MNAEFKCPYCGHCLSVEDFHAATQGSCPSSGKPLSESTPRPNNTTERTERDFRYCTRCGQRNLENCYRCTRCGLVLHGKDQAQYVITDDSTMGGLIPVKNARALSAYYLGIFSLIPCLGIPLGIAALIFGVMGLKHAELHPEARGKVHAWVGVILGSLCAVGYALLVVIPFLMGAFG